jgi:hypothetical protein
VVALATSGIIAVAFGSGVLLQRDASWRVGALFEKSYSGMIASLTPSDCFAAWHFTAIDHQTRQVLADVLGRRKEAVLRVLKQLLQPFGSEHFSTDHWGA